jgi:hypothetical protein
MCAGGSSACAVEGREVVVVGGLVTKAARGAVRNARESGERAEDN